MNDPRRIAERATVTNFLNCYLRETGKGEWQNLSSISTDSIQSYSSDYYSLSKAGTVLVLRLQSGNCLLYAVAQYKSPTGRHRFLLPLYCQFGNNSPSPIHYTTFLALLVEELSAQHMRLHASELHIRAIQSCMLLESFIRMRSDDYKELYELEQTFLQSEQSLLFGHTFHPTPKSRQGFPEWRQADYSPESKGSFQLHYFAVHRSLIQEQSEWAESAADIVRSELLRELNSEVACEERDSRYVNNTTYVLVPAHPVQAEGLLHEPRIKQWQQTGKITYLGALGRVYSPTSSIRTVYHPDSSYMFKFSLPVKITNSMRLNKRVELDTAIEAARLMTILEPRLKECYPHFHIIQDAAYMTVGNSTEDESGFELLIRHNPFIREGSSRVFVMASFTQEPIYEEKCLLVTIVQGLAKNENRNESGVCLDWFKKYLSISLEPMVWMYMHYGIALEAHLQNCLVRLDERGYPECFYYRDSQGYYYARSKIATLNQLLPGIRESANVYDDAIVEERFGYYLIVNHMLGLIQSFGSAGLMEEKVLLVELYAALEALLQKEGKDCSLIHNWLTHKSFRSKANLLTRLHDLDELECELEQAVYVEIENPLLGGLPQIDVIRRARLVTSSWRREREAERLVKL